MLNEIDSFCPSLVRKPSGFRIAVKQPITTGVLALTWLATYDIYKRLLVSCLVAWLERSLIVGSNECRDSGTL